ncbi:AbrB/MazE/SpoVT family DNA-binding domain-containing protein [Candidatus Poribacteria bacterium]|nr:AbrB/MazE/SpoVT family DNA-binding domain-containing protein [Candidatus Poribacteria bacterium]
MSRLTVKGQMTLPKEYREKLGIGPGDYVALLEMDERCYPSTVSLRSFNIVMNWSHEQLGQMSRHRWDDLAMPPFSINL